MSTIIEKNTNINDIKENKTSGVACNDPAKLHTHAATL
jgi:hypothetical protein